MFNLDKRVEDINYLHKEKKELEHILKIGVSSIIFTNRSGITTGIINKGYIVDRFVRQIEERIIELEESLESKLK